MSESLIEIIELAELLAREVGARAREVLERESKIEVNEKGRNDLVTEIDIWADKLISERIHQHFSTHTVIGEESHNELTKETGKSLAQLASSGTCWIVDPIDGTSNFVNRIPQFGISIAALKEGKRVAGVVYDPMKDELFKAVLNEGAYLNEKRISVSKRRSVENSIIATGFPPDRKGKWAKYHPVFEGFAQNSRAIRRYGAATLDICWVACGRFDGFFEYSLKCWDVAAGSLIVEEAGGRAGSFTEKEDTDFSLFSPAFLMAPQELYKDMHKLANSKAVISS